MIAEIKHERGSLAIDINSVQSIGYGKSYNNDKAEISVFINGFQNLYEIDSIEQAKQQYDKIIKLMVESSTEGTLGASSDNGYVKGFKDGCEYTLSLKDKKDV